MTRPDVKRSPKSVGSGSRYGRTRGPEGEPQSRSARTVALTPDRTS
jgi:hypothetical protein